MQKIKSQALTEKDLEVLKSDYKDTIELLSFYLGGLIGLMITIIFVSEDILIVLSVGLIITAAITVLTYYMLLGAYIFIRLYFPYKQHIDVYEAVIFNKNVIEEKSYDNFDGGELWILDRHHIIFENREAFEIDFLTFQMLEEQEKILVFKLKDRILRIEKMNLT